MRSPRGMSLVETTIILLVLMVIATVIAPSLYDMVVDAKVVRMKQDCEAIGVSITRLVLDVGPCLRFNGTDDCTDANHVRTLFSKGRNAGWSVAASDGMERQLSKNGARYPLPIWRGAYLPMPIGPDPWGSAYAANVGFLVPERDADCGIDTFCLSAGPDRRFGSDERGTVVSAGRAADDFMFTISGSPCRSGGGTFSN